VYRDLETEKDGCKLLRVKKTRGCEKREQAVHRLLAVPGYCVVSFFLTGWAKLCRASGALWS